MTSAELVTSVVFAKYLLLPAGHLHAETHGTVHAFENKELERFFWGIVPLPHLHTPLTLAVSTRNSFHAV